MQKNDKIFYYLKNFIYICFIIKTDVNNLIYTVMRTQIDISILTTRDFDHDDSINMFGQM